MSRRTPITIAAFDVDGTLTTRDSVVPFLRRMVTPRAVVRLMVHPQALIRGIVRRDRDALRAAATTAVFTGLPWPRVAAAGQAFGDEINARWLRPDAAARLGWHVANGHRVILVSASYGVYLDRLAEQLGAEAVLSTRLEVVDGRCTGRLDGPNCRGPEKVRRLRRWLDGEGLRRDEVEIWGYGDSAGDRELLADADRATWMDEPLASVVPS